MGCTASRPAELEEDHYPQQQQHAAVNDWYHPAAASKGISVPASNPQNPSLHHFNIVPLSTSTYGINMRPADQAGQTLSGYGDMQKDSMTQMLQVLESLDMGTSDPSAPPKRCEEVSSILEDLKPGLEKHFNQALGKPLKGRRELNGASLSLPVNGGKESAKPDLLPPSPAANSPTRQNSGSASPGIKPCRSKPSFASRFLKKSSSSVGAQQIDEATGHQSASAQATPLHSKEVRRAAGGGSLFDADFLASYESALKELTQEDWNALKNDADQRQRAAHSDEIAATEIGENAQEGQRKSQIPTALKKKPYDPLEKYEKRCPPGGEKSVIMYTTSLRGIRKTFEDCYSLRSVLESFQVSVDERDVAMHQGFRNELREMMGNKPVPVPRLFIKGHYIGGAEEVLQLHEEQQLAPLLQGLPQDRRSSSHPCDGCGGARFIPCLNCSGGRKIVDPHNPKEVIRCPDCNENGLIQCPICSLMPYYSVKQKVLSLIHEPRAGSR